MKYKVGDYVKTSGAIVGSGKITKIVKGGKDIGFPWDDDTPHYIFKDEKTGVEIIAHPRSLELNRKED